MNYKHTVAIVDYGMGNLFSVKKACEFVGLNAIITSDNSEIKASSGLILPGVGAFGDAMRNLEKLKLIGVLQEYSASGKLFVGICLGLQLLFTESEEFGINKGLNILQGKVVRFPKMNDNGKRNKIPHMGWNNIYSYNKESRQKWGKSFLRGISNDEYMYFVHSYYVIPENLSVVLSKTQYGGIEYCSTILHKNLFAVQYHPEKSSKEGIKIYKNIKKFIEEEKYD